VKQHEIRAGGLVLAALIAVAAVANLNLSVANVAIPDIGRDFDSPQTTLNLIAVGYSLGLAASVLWFGPIGDRYGRKLLIVLGMALSVPASLLAALAWSDTVLFAARVLGGLAAGMAFPTTLALISALWSGPKRTKAIALWSAIGGGVAALGPLVGGFLLEHFDWGSAFLVTAPLAAIALAMVVLFVPSHVNETRDPVDNSGGIISVFLAGALILAINFWSVPNMRTASVVAFAIALVAGVAFFVRERHARNPLYDLRVAARPTFWVAAVAGIIIFGTLTGVIYVSQQYVQNVLGYSTLASGASVLPAVVFLVLVAPRSAKLVSSHGSRLTLLFGYVFLVLALVGMLLLWSEDSPYWQIAIPFICIGIGVGLAGTPASNSLTGSVPVRRVGMASGTADLQRDLGGALMTSILGTILTSHYSSALASSNVADDVSDSTLSHLQLSYASAENIAAHYPQSADQIISAAQSSFLQGDQWTYAAALIAVVLGAALVFFLFPRKERELELHAAYSADDRAAAGAPPPDHQPVLAAGSG
jgi:MFS transporter, DHA2 family, multidrug resistance protein